MSKNLLLCFLLVIGLGTVDFATRAMAASPSDSQMTNHVSIQTPASGKQMLVVRYPWTLHRNPSIEVRTYVKDEEESVRIRPIHFRHAFMKDKTTITVYKTQEASSATRTVAEFSRLGIEFLAVGDRNLLGQPAVCLTCETKVLKPNRKPFTEKARWAVYPLLEPWAADNQTLFITLPEPTFSGPAKIRVFFLRDDDLVWSEIEQWPGLDEPDSPPAAK